MVITDNIINEIDNYLIDTLSPERYEHSLSTGITAEKLCINFGLNSEKGYFTGLIHDIAREYDDEELVDICSSNGNIINSQERKSPVLLHGKAGAEVLKDKFNIFDDEILDSIRVHTTGAPGMSSMAKVLFIADYIEPCRKHITVEYLETLKNRTLDSMFKIVFKSIMEYLKKSGQKASESSIELLKELEV